ncbi:hypothetical protein H5410_014823 [Solanum commersonii]|uniref:Uncharacterized protein n=1 Tax=Solanum commersonii TaxID=4109 RepID=A0A9J5ZSL3_SOLCO|nr:hypothetical protein H5410_014823 [Solanum commersonii]
MDHRLWMYNMHYETGAGLKLEFIDGVRDFIDHTMTLDIFKNNGLVRCPCSGMEPEQYFDEAPNEEARRFYDQLKESNRPLCEGSTHSTLSVAVRLMNIKSYWNVPNVAMDSMVDLLGELVNPEFNIPKNFYQAKCLISKLGLTETGDFYSYYFGDEVSCRRNRRNHNDEGDIDPLFPPI